MNVNKILKRDYSSIYELCEDAIDTYCDSNEHIGFIAKYDEAKCIITELCKLGLEINSCKINNPEFNGYNDEFIISVYENKIWCEQAKRCGKYIHSDCSVLYLIDNCNSKLIPCYEPKVAFEVRIIDDNYCFDDEYNCYKYNDDYTDNDLNTDDMHGFTVSKNNENGYASISFYSTERFNKEDLMDLINIFGL